MRVLLHSLAGLVLYPSVLVACVEETSPDAGGAGGGGAAGDGGAPACQPYYEELTGDQIATLDASEWPGPFVMSREGEARTIGHVSLDADGSARWVTIGSDFTFHGTAVWQAEGSGILITEGNEKLDWPLGLVTGVESIQLERIDDRHIAAHITATTGGGDEVWVPGSLCHGCTPGPAYPCDLDFEQWWDLLNEDP